MANQTKGFRRIVNAANYSRQGVVAAWKHEEAFRQEALLAIILIPLGLWLGDSGLSKAMLVACVLLVLIVEILNSAIEAVVDRIGAEQHELAGRAKDMGSAAVSIALANVVIVWALVLLTK